VEGATASGLYAQKYKSRVGKGGGTRVTRGGYKKGRDKPSPISKQPGIYALPRGHLLTRLSGYEEEGNLFPGGKGFSFDHRTKEGNIP